MIPSCTPKTRLGEVLRAQLGERRVRLGKLEAHPAEDALGLRELHLVVLDDLDEVAPRIEEVEATAGTDLDAGSLERAARRLLVVNDESKVPHTVGAVGSTLHQREELVAHVDERRSRRAAAQGELEDSAVERERLVNVADLERDVVDADEARHGRIRWMSPNSCQ